MQQTQNVFEAHTFPPLLAVLGAPMLALFFMNVYWWGVSYRISVCIALSAQCDAQLMIVGIYRLLIKGDLKRVDDTREYETT
jgi:hypothetical protein